MDAAFAIAPGRLLAAAATIFITTVENVAWLVPMMSHGNLAVLHGVTFVSTFTGLSLTISIVAVLFEQSTMFANQDLALSMIGAGVCWALAAFLYYRAWKKRRQHQSSVLAHAEEQSLLENGMYKIDGSSVEYGSIPFGEQQSKSTTRTIPHGHHESQVLEVSTPQVWLVVSLTIIGSIDEVCYYPGLIIGKVFSVAELTIGTILASLMTLAIVCLFLAPCQPIISFLDQIPLYGIVGFFAILLTLKAVSEVWAV